MKRHTNFQPTPQTPKVWHCQGAIFQTLLHKVQRQNSNALQPLTFQFAIRLDHGSRATVFFFLCRLEAINVTLIPRSAIPEYSCTTEDPKNIHNPTIPLCQTSWPHTEVMEDAMLWHLHLPGRGVYTTSGSRRATASRCEARKPAFIKRHQQLDSYLPWCCNVGCQSRARRYARSNQGIEELILWRIRSDPTIYFEIRVKSWYKWYHLVPS